MTGYGVAAMSALAAFLVADRRVEPDRHARPRSALPLLVSLIAVVALAVAVMAQHALLAVAVGPLATGLARSIARSERSHRMALARHRRVPAAVEVLARLLATGMPVSGALGALSPEQVEMLGLTRVIARIHGGERLSDVLSEFEGLVPAALLAAELSGGNASAPMERLSYRLRWAALDGRTAQSLSGQQLASAAVMAFFPVVVAVLYGLSDRRAAEFYLHTWWGTVSVAASLTLSYLGWAWMRYLTRARVPS
ncbi:MAG: hypothetical protein HKN24_14945 [Acidimicrobiales bacterium]|nr:hypothetical protein [Acidimicrobiales bacterium]